MKTMIKSVHKKPSLYGDYLAKHRPVCNSQETSLIRLRQTLQYLLSLDFLEGRQ